MNDTIWVALIIAVFGPLALSWRNDRQHRRDKREEWARQDVLAERALEVEKIVSDTQDTVRVVHQLVNSEKTEGLKREQTIGKTLLVFMQRDVERDLAAGETPDPATLDAIETVQTRLGELAETLAERERAQRDIDTHFGTTG